MLKFFKLDYTDLNMIDNRKLPKWLRVEIVDNKYAANLVSPFLNQLKSWENEDDFSIPDDILENIKNELGFIKPS